MLHLIFSLPHAWGGTTTKARCLCCLIPEIFLLALIIGPHNDFHSHLDLRSWHFANDVLDAYVAMLREFETRRTLSLRERQQIARMQRYVRW